MPAPRVQERRAVGMPGLPFLLIALVVVLGGAALVVTGGLRAKDHPGGLAAVLIGRASWSSSWRC